MKEHIGFLEASANSFDSGFVGEAKRLAVTIRVLVHDTATSHSLLGQLGVKDAIRYVDTAERIRPGNLLPTLGLVMLQVTGGSGGDYVPPLGNLAPPRIRNPVPFSEWWTTEVTKEPGGETWTRRKYVLTLANKEGGAHVDSNLDDEYERLARNNRFGWTYIEVAQAPVPFRGDPVLASVRQIAYELSETLRLNSSLLS